MLDPDQAREAIEAVAPRREGRATPSAHAFAGARNTILRFLENIPEDVVVMDLRRVVEDL